MRPARRQHANGRSAVGEGARQRVDADLGDLLDGERQHAGRQPVAEPGQRVDERLTMPAVVQQEHRGLAARIPVAE